MLKKQKGMGGAVFEADSGSPNHHRSLGGSHKLSVFYQYPNFGALEDWVRYRHVLDDTVSFLNVMVSSESQG